MKIVILIWELRKSKSMSIRKLSRLSGVSHTEISRIEASEVSPTLETLLKLANALGVDINSTFVISL